jgi:16S rRNA (guanine(966)-N(2))-methyltransferase RsmD
MRIISGRFKGRILKSPKGAGLRPTSQRVKEALFNILGERICGASFLELFAGSGSIGIEALSRGAKRVVFVENNRLCIKAIQENLALLGVASNCVTILPLTVQKALTHLAAKGDKFDLVFLDPPYNQKSPLLCFPEKTRGDHQIELKNSLIKAAQCGILNPCSYLIAEHSKRGGAPQGVCGLNLIFSKGYGDTELSFYEK